MENKENQNNENLNNIKNNAQNFTTPRDYIYSNKFS